LFKIHSGRKFLLFLQGTVGDFAPDCPPDFSRFTAASETGSGMPTIVGLGIVGNLATVCSPEFTKFTMFSETGSATPVIADFGIVSGSSLEFATTT